MSFEEKLNTTNWSPEDWEEYLSSHWLWNIDEKIWITSWEIKKISTDILDINEEMDDISFSLYEGKKLIWVVEYSKNKEWICIDFLATINWDTSKIVADNEFRTKFIEYFWDTKKEVNWLWSKLINRFIDNIKSNEIITLVSVEWSKWFYEKILLKMEKEWKISILSKIPEYQILVL